MKVAFLFFLLVAKSVATEPMLRTGESQPDERELGRYYKRHKHYKPRYIPDPVFNCKTCTDIQNVCAIFEFGLSNLFVGEEPGATCKRAFVTADQCTLKETEGIGSALLPMFAQSLFLGPPTNNTEFDEVQIRRMTNLLVKTGCESEKDDPAFFCDFCECADLAVNAGLACAEGNFCANSTTLISACSCGLTDTPAACALFPKCPAAGNECRPCFAGFLNTNCFQLGGNCPAPVGGPLFGAHCALCPGPYSFC